MPRRIPNKSFFLVWAHFLGTTGPFAGMRTVCIRLQKGDSQRIQLHPGSCEGQREGSGEGKSLNSLALKALFPAYFCWAYLGNSSSSSLGIHAPGSEHTSFLPHFQPFTSAVLLPHFNSSSTLQLRRHSPRKPP